MKDIGLQCLYIIVSTIMPIIAGFLAVLIKQKISEITQRIENEKIATYTNNITGVLIDAVLEVEQTYVDQLKKQGKFTPQAQKVAKEKAFEIASNLITVEGKKVINDLYGDFKSYAMNKIEALVKQFK